MSQISAFANLPGIQAVQESYDQGAILWGPAANIAWWNGYIDANAVDSGASPTYRLRPGLVLGQITASGRWTNYSPTATDGSEVAGAVLAYGLRMQDVFSGANVEKYYALVVGGRVVGGNLFGLDRMARAQMSPRFLFDDDLFGNIWFPFKRFQTKTAAYTIVAADNGTEFRNTGATASVTLTLPALANGYFFGFRSVADQNFVIASAAGSDMVVFNNASASSVAFSTAGERIGGGWVVYSNPGATKWHVWQTSAGSAHTVTLT